MRQFLQLFAFFLYYLKKKKKFSCKSPDVSVVALPLCSFLFEYSRLFFAFFLADSCVRACCHGFQLSSGAVQREEEVGECGGGSKP